MASTQMKEYSGFVQNITPHRYDIQRAMTERIVQVNDMHAFKGRILWLPPQKELPKRAVRKAHGKGAVEAGIFDHPVVVVSRPSEESHVVHFLLISSLQGKRLDQLYPMTSEFNESRRSWYLPIAPTPVHPDALSKKTKKRFPTLELAHGETLRWNSYVNIRHVYKINMSLLQPYINPDRPNTEVFRFERESTIRILSKCKTLTFYEPGEQFVYQGLQRSNSDPTSESTASTLRAREEMLQSRPLEPLTHTVVSRGRFVVSGSARVDFQTATPTVDRVVGVPQKVPPDSESLSIVASVVQDIVKPWEQLVRDAQLVEVVAQRRLLALSNASVVLRNPLCQFWRDVKGVTAVAIASI